MKTSVASGPICAANHPDKPVQWCLAAGLNIGQERGQHLPPIRIPQQVPEVLDVRARQRGDNVTAVRGHDPQQAHGQPHLGGERAGPQRRLIHRGEVVEQEPEPRQQLPGQLGGLHVHIQQRAQLDRVRPPPRPLVDQHRHDHRQRFAVGFSRR
jgi:hypothetical protein